MKQRKPRIAVIGTLVYDEIHLYGGGVAHGWGGIYYTVSYLAGLLGERAFIEPVIDVGYDLYEDFLELMQREFPQVSLEGIRKINQRNNRVTLIYQSPDRRVEYSHHIPPPLPFERIRPYVHHEVIVLNLISGFDLTLETAQQTRKAARGLILMDLHSLALGREDNGRRFYRRPDNWEEWIKIPHILQMNEMEFRVLSGDELEEPRAYQEFGFRLLDYGVPVLNVTLGPKGSLLFWREKGRKQMLMCPPLKLAQVVDATGCGDAFIAGFIARYVETGDPQEAARFANVIGGLNCLFPSVQGAHKLRSLVDTAFECYRREQVFSIEQGL